MQDTPIPGREAGAGEIDDAQLSGMISVVVGVLVLGGLYATQLAGYPLFHSLTEFAAASVSVGIFMIAWNSRRFMNNNYLLAVGIALLFVGIVQLLHTFAYKGMGVFGVEPQGPLDTLEGLRAAMAREEEYEANLATQLWIAGRYMLALAFVLASAFAGRKVRVGWTLAAWAGGTALVLAGIFLCHAFPACFVPGVGLTRFKVVSEYMVMLMFAGAIALLLAHRAAFDRSVLRLLVATLALFIAADAAFTFYTDVYGFLNAAGHVLNTAGFILVYKALIETGLKRPYGLLFRDLKMSEAALARERDGLEAKVAERTEDLKRTNESLLREAAEREQAVRMLRNYQARLRMLAAQLSLAEERERRRLATQLHDHVGQALAVAKMRLGSLKGAPPDECAKGLVEIREYLDEAIKSTRELTSEMGSPTLYEFGLVAALESHVEAFRRRHGISIALAADGDGRPIKGDLAVILFQAARELLFNVVKHARARSARVSISRESDMVRLQVEDDGVGFSPAEAGRATPAGGGFGLFSIRERLTQAGGRVEVDSAPGKGTRVTLWAPAVEDAPEGAG